MLCCLSLYAEISVSGLDAAGAFMGLWSMMTNNGGSGKFVSSLGAAPGIKVLVCGASVF